MDALRKVMRTAVKALNDWPARSVSIFHHNDADGLSSAAILTDAFTRKQYSVQRVCLEKPYPQVLDRIFQDEGRLLVFADFAGRIAPLLARLNKGRNLIIILDHHPAQPADGANLHHLNPELFGMQGDRDICAATTCYLFARELDPANEALAHLAVVGAVGDRFMDEGRLTGENRLAMHQAEDQGTIEIQHQGSQESYWLHRHGQCQSVEQVVTMLEAFGAVGYYRKGPEIGIAGLQSGFSRQLQERFRSLEARRRDAFEKMINVLKKGGLKQSKRIQWFHAGEQFAPMGVKTIGMFCQSLLQMEFIHPHKYLLGFQTLPDAVPGFGEITFNAVKISMRVPPSLAIEIRRGDKPGLDTFLPVATNRLGGFSDGCHSLAAATTLARGREQGLIREMESLLGA